MPREARRAASRVLAAALRRLITRLPCQRCLARKEPKPSEPCDPWVGWLLPSTAPMCNSSILVGRVGSRSMPRRRSDRACWHRSWPRQVYRLRSFVRRSNLRGDS